jgi:hypothetical protein
MKNFRIKIALLLFSSLLIFGGCDKNDDNDPAKLEAFTVMVDATSYTEWVFFSFSEGIEVSVSDPMASANWDIGIKRNHFRTNSGTSGNGAGGAFDAGVVDFDSYSEGPGTGYTEDDSIEVFSFANMEYASEPGNAVLETWGEFTDENPPTLIPASKVFVVKTADGKYAKIIIQNYYSTDGSGHVTFTYTYQADGTTNLY